MGIWLEVSLVGQYPFFVTCFLMGGDDDASESRFMDMDIVSTPLPGFSKRIYSGTCVYFGGISSVLKSI